MEGIELPSALALLLRANLLGARERPFERGLQLGLVGDLAADVADEAAEPRAQQAQLPMVTLELLGMSIARSHHRRVLGDTQIRLPHPYSAFIGQTLSPLIAACSSLASVGKVMALGCTVVSTVTRLRSRVRSAPASRYQLGPRRNYLAWLQCCLPGH